jgi:uncharacterized protein (TIGR02996 family)
MRPETRALFDAVLKRPEDDGARLVLADHLTELGDPQGELLSVQLTAPDGRTRGLARIRERELLGTHQKTWVPPGVMPRTASFRRGLLARCTWSGPTDPLHRGWLSVSELDTRWADGIAPEESPFHASTRPMLTRLLGAKPHVWQALLRCSAPRLSHVDIEFDARAFVTDHLEPLSALPSLEVLHFSAPLADVASLDELSVLELICRTLSPRVPSIQLRVRRALFEPASRASWRNALKGRVELIDVLEPEHRRVL